MTQDVHLPDWYQDLAVQFKANIAHEFILHGNISDFVPNPDAADEPNRPYLSFRQFFEKMFEERNLVMFYNISSGLKFLDSMMEDRFRKIAGIDSDDAAKSPLAKAGVLQKKSIPREPEVCLPLIEKALRSSEKVAIILNFVHHIAPNSGPGGIALSTGDRVNTELLIHWAQNEEIKNKRNIILLVSDQLADISTQLRQSNSGIQSICVPKPAKEERTAFLRSITEGNKACQETRARLKELLAKKATSRNAKKKTEIEEEIQTCRGELSALMHLFQIAEVPDGFDAEIFSLATQGMSYRQIFDIFLHNKETGKEIDLNFVKEKKRKILNDEYGDLLEIVEPARGLEDIGGLEYIKLYIQDILRAVASGDARLVPMGITLMGPPGTGKTAIVEAVAKEAGFNFVKTRNIRNMFVGESEARMQKMVYALRSLAPVVVMNDEAEQMESSRDEYSGDSGVSNRLRKSWMEFLSDPKIRGQVLVINCTNRPDLIDVALKRSGRSDDRIPMLMPAKTERALIFKVMVKRYNIPTTITDFDRFAEITENLSGADIENITLRAYKFAAVQGKAKVDEAVLQEAIEDFVPSANRAEIDRMTLMAIQECSSRKLLPQNVKEIIAQIKARNLVKVDDSICAVLGNNH